MMFTKLVKVFVQTFINGIIINMKKNKNEADWNTEDFRTLIENLPTILNFFLSQEKIKKSNVNQYYSQRYSCTEKITFNIVFVKS